MVLDIIFNLFILIAAVFFFINAGIDPRAAATATELGAAFWPRLILGIIIILSVISFVNMYREHKKTCEADGDSNDDKEKRGIAWFFKSKLFRGMILCAITAFILPKIGFIPTSFLFLISYGILLGERRPHILVITGILATLIIYVVFQGALSIFLPRGFGIFRDFGMMMEDLVSIFFK